jgi:hypothetical protein
MNRSVLLGIAIVGVVVSVSVSMRRPELARRDPLACRSGACCESAEATCSEDCPVAAPTATSLPASSSSLAACCESAQAIVPVPEASSEGSWEFDSWAPGERFAVDEECRPIPLSDEAKAAGLDKPTASPDKVPTLAPPQLFDRGEAKREVIVVQVEAEQASPSSSAAP